MMRWLALALVAANLVYAGWQWQLRSAGAAEVLPQKAGVGYEGVPRLVLLSERPAPPLSDEPAVVAADSGPAPEPPVSCGVLGPFGELVSARQVQGRLEDSEIAAQLRSREVAVRSDFWVHIPPLPSRDAALRLLRELQARGVDSFLIADGDLERGISLGIFSREDSAERVAQQHRQQEYPVAVRELPRHQAEYWLALSPEAAAAVDAALLERLRGGGLKVEFSSRPCIDVAQLQEFD